MRAENNAMPVDKGAARRRLWRVAWGLARNDFHARFAGSYFGILWAFAQPVATILLFWFVFQVGFRAAPTAGRDVWIFLGGIAGGATIWCTHFVAMMAYSPGVDVAYEPVLTAT